MKQTVLIQKKNIFHSDPSEMLIDPLEDLVFFAYEDGDFTIYAPFRRASIFKSEKSMLEALELADHRCAMVPCEVSVYVKPSPFSVKESLRERALAKLTESEKKILGL